MNIKKLESKVKDLEERRERILEFIDRNKNNHEMLDFVNISKGQALEILAWISYVQDLIKELKGE
jgi:hypothetical protein